MLKGDISNNKDFLRQKKKKKNVDLLLGGSIVNVARFIKVETNFGASVLI